MENNVLDKQKLTGELRDLHKKLVGLYEDIFNYKYSNNEDFNDYIEKQYSQNNISKRDQKKWNQNFCHRASYTLLNKILFVRICEDKGFMRNPEDYIAGEISNPHIGEKLTRVGFQNWTNIITNYTFGELIDFAFLDMKKSYNNIILYKDSKYEILNPTINELDFKYIDSNIKIKEFILRFEKILTEIIEKLDVKRFDFAKTDSNILGDVYEQFMDRETRKSIGQFYTPEFIIEYILMNTVSNEDVVKNPFVKVADIACGSGHFLIMAYDILKEKFINNLEKLRYKYKEEKYLIKKDNKIEYINGDKYWVKENIHYHLLKHCIYGSDIDSFAVQLTTINLLLKDLDNFTDELNIIQSDSLVKWEEDYEWRDLKSQLKEEFETIKSKHLNLFGEEEIIETTVRKETYKLKYKNTSGVIVEDILNREDAESILSVCKFWNTKFDYIVGNPPYIGHKQLGDEYKTWLLNNYEEVFKDKSDLSFCFFHRISKILSWKGISGIITSRYFMESPTGKMLRTYLVNKTNMIEIVDFYGAEIFKGVGIATSIYFFEKYKESGNKIKIHKLIDDGIVFEDNTNLKSLISTNLFESFQTKQQILEDERWILIPENHYKIYKKINDKSNFKLQNIAESFQGIITGRDRAFVMSDESVVKNKIEKDLLKIWIKNSNVKKYEITESNLKLIYADSIEDEKQYPNSIKFISKHRDRLENRRECKSGVRKWYELQWGRDSEMFEQKKIVFPYKSKSNRFALDINNSYCSADVYSLIIKDKFKKEVPIEYLVGILNSKIYEFYFKLFAKKMGKGIYDYYPNSIMDLKVTLDANMVDRISKKVREVIEKLSLLQKVSIKKMLEDDDLVKSYLELKKSNFKIKEEIFYLQQDIDKLIANYYKLNDKDLDVINENLNLSNVKSAKIILDENKYYNEYVKEKKSIYEISEKYSIEKEIIEILWLEYMKDDISNNYNLINIEKLLIEIILHLKEESIKIFKDNINYLEIEDVSNIFMNKVFGFERLIEVFKIENLNFKSIDVIKKTLNPNSYTWNAYRKAKDENKVNRTFIKYYDSDYYGLSEWSDEIHKQYFLDAIEEYTETDPNEKKAKDILKLFKDLDIEDKKDYLSVIEGKINRVFK